MVLPTKVAEGATFSIVRDQGYGEDLQFTPEQCKRRHPVRGQVRVSSRPYRSEQQWPKAPPRN